MHALYTWLRLHPRFVDGLLALGVLGAGLGLLPVMWRREPLLAVVVVALAVPVVFRREHPAGVFAVVTAVGAVQVLADTWPTGADVAIVIALYTLAARRPRRDSLLALAACLAGAVVAWFRWGFDSHGTRPATALMVIALLGAVPLLAWLLGDSVRWRYGYFQAVAEKAERLERERHALAQVAAAAERARIARELHDVVAHHVSVIVVQADGARYSLDAAPEDAREAIEVIGQTGRQALAEMRRLLGILRSADGEVAGLAPAPGLWQLDDLLAHSAAAGVAVGVEVRGTPWTLPGGADLVAYRVVQESLTNVRKHAGPGARATLTLGYADGELTITVTDDGRGAAARPAAADPGYGLAGMRERVAMHGGTVDAAPRPGGGYRVTATLPLPAERSAAA